MPRKPTKPTLKQSKLDFGAFKATAASNKSKKEPITITGPVPVQGNAKTTINPPSPASVQDEKDDLNVDEIETPESESTSELESDIQDGFAGEERKVESELETDVPYTPPPVSLELEEEEEPAELKETIKEKGPAITGVSPLQRPAPQSPERRTDSALQAAAVDASSRPHLNIKNRAYNEISADANKQTGHLKLIHEDKANRVEKILRVFDLNYDYGPCVGMARLDRWERAKELGLNPPQEIHDILMTQEGLTDPKYSKDVLTSLV